MGFDFEEGIRLRESGLRTKIIIKIQDEKFQQDC